MNVKFNQVIDNVHGTIYYTKLEQKIINTPFFNRLHDVNQSSTVYLTFPPNRTKRYEHSLGTMQLTSEVFYNAAMNSSGSEAMNLMMDNAKKAFEEIINYIKNTGEVYFPFSQKVYGNMDYVKGKEEKDIINIIEENFLQLFHGNCLLNYLPSGLNKGYDAFLFLCLLQSIRIVGLLHDIGHPPQSHIIESVLEEIDYELRELPNHNIRQKRFIAILSSYKDTNHESIKLIDQKMAIKTKNAKKEHLHEMVGIQIIKQIVNYVFPNLMDNNIKDVQCNNSAINMLYYFTVIEFVFAIVRNKNAYWIGLHNIIDGTIDTDRLDFVPRDSQNSGMAWGKVPYKRLINTVKFGIVSENKFEQSVHVCFADKNIQQMDDLLNNRYKIFTMINYHHRSTKIASLYQKAVKILATEYLDCSKQDTKELSYFSNISGLWRAIEIAYSQESSVLNLIQWNDSWLNGLLYRHMVEESKVKSGVDKIGQCCQFLREVFLNENHHHSLIKRQADMIEINEQVVVMVSDLIDEIGKELKAVQGELAKSRQRIEDNNKKNVNTQGNTINKLLKKEEAYKILLNLYDALNQLNWPTIEAILGTALVSDAVKKVISNHSEMVTSYVVEKVKFSLGTDYAYVYDKYGKLKSYYQYSNIKEVLSETRLGFPFFYIYINFIDYQNITADYFSKLRMEIGKELGEAIKVGVDKNISFDATKGKK